MPDANLRKRFIRLLRSFRSGRRVLAALMRFRRMPEGAAGRILELLLGEEAAGAAVAACRAAPKVTPPLSTSGVSGFMLSFNFSIVMVCGGGGRVLAAFLASGVFIGMPELGGRNFAGNLSCGSGFASGNRSHDLRRDDDNQLGIRLGLLHRLEELADDRYISQKGNLIEGVRFGIVQKSANDKALAVGEFDFRIDFSGGNGRNFKSGERNGIGKIQGADFRSNLKPNGSARGDGRNEIKANAIFLEHDGNRAAAAARAALHHRIRIFASGEEAGLLSIGGDHIRLCQNLPADLGLSEP